jgi:tRNA/tmRNA/rRNA uracil-C5-methylase (TrmA/RlmC/RlmD family)
LARDARLLADEGYAHRGTVVFDVFPNTSHIEAVTRFDRV